MRFLWIFLLIGCTAKQPPANPVAQAPVAADEAESTAEVSAWVGEALERIDKEVSRAQASWDRPDASDDPQWVASRLAHLVEIDQIIRMSAHTSSTGSRADLDAYRDGVVERMTDADQRHTAELKELIARHGWPRISVFGEEASRHAWLLAQHADLDRDFQREVLALMEPMLAEEEVTPKNYAYLFDRIATSEGRPQRFGTQGVCPADGGDWEPGSVEEPDRIDAIRAEVGLGTMAEYRAVFDCQGLRSSADRAYAVKNYAVCAEEYAVYAAVRTGVSEASGWYNAACCASLAGDMEGAFAYLERAVDAGYSEPAHAAQDADLTSLHADPRWQGMLERMASGESE